MHTTSYWLTIPPALMGLLPYAADDRRDGVVGLAFAMGQIAQLLLMCDRHDIGISIDAENPPDALCLRAYSSTTTTLAASASASRCFACTASCSKARGVSSPSANARAAALGASVPPGTPARLPKWRRSGFSNCSWLMRTRVRSRTPARTYRSWRSRRRERADRSAARHCRVHGAASVMRANAGQADDRRFDRARPGRASGRGEGGSLSSNVASMRRRRTAARSSAISRAKSRVRAATRRLLTRAHRTACTGAPACAPFVFFDLETTGLSGGAGTYAFLVGCGWFDDDGAFVMRQHLLVDYGIERSMLERVNPDLDRAGALVSFNGKSFDVPLLETRYLFHRMEWAGRRLPHIDVLHPARQFWKHGGRTTEQSCSLAALEGEILGVVRTDDVPGFDIPSRYFQFVRSGDARPLAAVLEHNQLDLLSLAGLTARLMALVREGPAHARNAWEALALGRVYARAGLDMRAHDAFELAAASKGADSASASAAQAEALRMLAVMLRRARRFDEAAACWQRLLDLPSCPADVVLAANEALAIHHEHRVRDLTAAKTFALRSLKDGVGYGMDAGTGSGWNDAVRHRLQRIERKLTSGRPLFPSWPSQPSRPSSGSPRSAHRTSS